ncbi:MAG: 4-hydroxythreonine-4-phosphate dehydrogenase PdxA [Myxococcota bacterium]|jgi:4-hydroxythreonine-4-phosphate dehydrogenase|nr:4-hydroxythreonine-4-phosphate dehydrogenase PdxA [Myxococcota bacterium]
MKRIALSVGDPAGIGPEIAIRAAVAPSVRQQLQPILVGPGTLLEDTARGLGIVPSTLLIEDVDCPDLASVKPGQLSAAAGLAAYLAIERAVQLCRSHRADAICTAPIHKGALRLAGIHDVGHTELLSRLLDGPEGLTLFITASLRIFFFSRHLSLRQAIDALNVEDLAAFAERAHRALTQLGFERPSLALAALNPHAGDGGQFGDEETRILAPAVSLAQSRGVRLSGPWPADSVFHQAAEGSFDAVLSLYHDQGHIAAKTRDFHGTVSATLGLPVLRTSVDHGTAMDIAGRGIAEPRSMIAALLAAAELLERRAAVKIES